MMNERVKEGCKKCMFAPMNEGGTDFETPEKLEGLVELQYQYTYAEGKADADNETKIYKKKPTGADFTLTFLNVPTKTVAKILGKKYSKGGMETGTGDNPIPVALLFQETYSDNSYVNTVFYNVKLSRDENSAKSSSSDNIEFTNITLTGKAIPFTNEHVEGAIDFRIDSAESDVDQNKLQKFFEKVRYLSEEVA
ncbi:phage tail protein [Clostridium perfringens]|uniref:Phage tail protein n=2 Tax=Clostridiaceae TaxID=31979 RepID=A0AB37C620_CLOPF|nr:phage tail protein [Clostridium perfringens]MBS4958074.1 phage tail protein [Clostridium sp.]EHK2349296.1 phage tail protein [Clostridium perfringens]EHK2365726.1 phage tail protein [Clostridium perfringens]EIF6153707.1 phage tail protein [Clostridium perfringens]